MSKDNFSRFIGSRSLRFNIRNLSSVMKLKSRRVNLVPLIDLKDFKTLITLNFKSNKLSYGKIDKQKPYLSLFPTLYKPDFGELPNGGFEIQQRCPSTDQEACIPQFQISPDGRLIFVRCLCFPIFEDPNDSNGGNGGDDGDFPRVIPECSLSFVERSSMVAGDPNYSSLPGIECTLTRGRCENGCRLIFEVEEMDIETVTDPESLTFGRTAFRITNFQCQCPH